MTRDASVFGWECPICSETKLSLATADRVGIEEQATNALLSHVRTRIGDGHGPEGELPPVFDPDDALEHVGLDGEVDVGRRSIPR